MEHYLHGQANMMATVKAMFSTHPQPLRCLVPIIPQFSKYKQSPDILLLEWTRARVPNLADHLHLLP